MKAARVYFAHAGIVILLALFATTVLSDSGVWAMEDNPLHISVPGKSTTLPAHVITTGSDGSIEVIRPSWTKLSSALVLTGLHMSPSGQVMEALKKNDFPKMATIYRQRVLTGQDTPATRLGLAAALWLDGDLDDSLRAYSWAKIKDPKNPDVRMGMALVMIELGATDQAVLEISPLLDSPEQRAAALNNLGTISRTNDNYLLASEQFSMALLAHPHMASAQYNLATTEMDLQNFKQAAVEYRKVSEQLPGFTESYFHEGLAHMRANEPVLAAVALNRARELDSTNPAIALALGLTDQALGMDAQAAPLLAQALKNNPSDQRVHQLLANSLLRSGQEGRAAKILQQAFALVPRNSEEYFHQGLKMFLCDRPDLASRLFFKALSKGKKDPEVFFALGQSLLQADKVDAAIESLSVASRLSPDSADIHFALGLAFRAANRNEQAIREMNTATALKPSDKDMQILLMNTLRDTKKFKRCASIGSSLLSLHPELVSARFELAFCQAMGGELKQARESLENAIKLDMDGTEIHSLWRHLESMIKHNTHEPGAYLLWATIQDQRGNWDKAIEAYEKFILSKPPRGWVVKVVEKIRYLSSAEVSPASP